jgi:UDP-N-acetylglucosamine--N-acetylmuramyl-(pentapeptide) pyrophosphoryl-undecaprenol N-acetylglucosamine transferase
LRWLIAAGGTGGHVFPALSLAQAIKDEYPQAEVVFVGTRRGLEARLVPQMGFDLRTIPSRGLMGLGLRERVLTILALPWTAMKCARILASLRPNVVVGMGGYVAGPIVLLAAIVGIPTAIAEQNSIAGRTNRLLGRFAKRVFLGFPQAQGAFPQEKVLITGNPVRRELLEAAARRRPSPWKGSEEEEFHLLVFGGSQGAKAIDEAMVEAIPMFAQLPFRLRVLHQTAPDRIEWLEEKYSEAGLEHEVVAFIERMEEAYLWAHLAICRAGAMSLAELALFGVPSILIPYPYATDDHQRKNAQAWESAGASLVLDQKELSGRRLFELVRALSSSPQRLGEMARAARGLARPSAASEMVRECAKLLEGKRR